MKYKNYALNFLFFMSIFANLILIGGIFNLIAVAYNGGKMPVYDSSNYFMDSPHHFSYAFFKDVNFPIFTDIFNFFECYYFSIGDIFILFGMVFAIFLYIKLIRDYYLLKKSKRLRKRKNH